MVAEAEVDIVRREAGNAAVAMLVVVPGEEAAAALERLRVAAVEAVGARPRRTMADRTGPTGRRAMLTIGRFNRMPTNGILARSAAQDGPSIAV